jgi:hypothetical protein
MKTTDAKVSWVRSAAWTMGAWCALLPGMGLAAAKSPPALDKPAKEVSAARVIKIDRPEKVGSKSEISIKSLAQETTQTKYAGAPLAEEKTYGGGSIRAIREVLAVGKNGRATQLKFAIQSLKFTADPNAEPKELFPTGKEVTAELKEGETTFTIDGKPVAANLDDALQLFGLVNDGPASDVLFNTTVPHAVGDEWNADLREATKHGSFKDFTFDLRASTGKVRLERIEKVNGIECYIVTCKMTLIPTGMAGQAGADLAGSSLKFATTIPVPVDPAAPELGCKTEDDTVFKIRFKTAAGPKVDSTSKSIREEEIRESPPVGK